MSMALHAKRSLRHKKNKSTKPVKTAVAMPCQTNSGMQTAIQKHPSLAIWQQYCLSGSQSGCQFFLQLTELPHPASVSRVDQGQAHEFELKRQLKIILGLALFCPPSLPPSLDKKPAFNGMRPADNRETLSCNFGYSTYLFPPCCSFFVSSLNM